MFNTNILQQISIVPFTIVSTLGMFGYKSLSEAVSIIFAVVNPFYTGISGIYGIFAVSKICFINVSPYIVYYWCALINYVGNKV